MNRKAKLLSEQAGIVDERDQLIALWDKEDRGPDDKEKTRAKEIEARLIEIDSELEIVAQADARQRQNQTYNRDLEPPTEEELAAAASASAASASAAAAATAGTGADIGKKPRGFSSFGGFLQAVQRAETPGNPVDQRLFAVATGMGEEVPSDGGFLVERQRETDIRDKMWTLGEVLKRTDNIPIGVGSDGVKIPAVDETSRKDGSRWGGIRAYWVDEGGTLTASKPKIKLLDLRLKKEAALLYVTDELLKDAVALESFATRRVPLELTFVAENALFRGTGAGMPLGILNAPAKIRITKEVGQGGNTIKWENIKKMWTRMFANSRGNAAWWVNQDVEEQLMSMVQVVGTGGIPVYLPANGAAGSPFATLMGRPVIPVEYCSTLGTEGDIILADFSQYITIDKGGVQTASSMHVRFLNDEMTFRFVFRIDGQPLWSSALTPFQGTNTQSPFITLETRT